MRVIQLFVDIANVKGLHHFQATLVDLIENLKLIVK